MTENQSQWRPPVASKPVHIVQSVARVRDDAALRGATRAFVPVHTQITITKRASPASGAALAAATATATSRSQHSLLHKKLPIRDEGDSPERGRPTNVRIPTSNAAEAAWKNTMVGTLAPSARPLYASRSPSAIAARLASTTASPSRVQTESGNIRLETQLPFNPTEDYLVKHVTQKFESLSSPSASVNAARKASGGYHREGYLPALDTGNAPISLRYASHAPPQPSPGGIAAAASAMRSAKTLMPNQFENPNELLEDDDFDQDESSDTLSRYVSAETSAGESSTPPITSFPPVIEANSYFPVQVTPPGHVSLIQERYGRTLRTPATTKLHTVQSYGARNTRVADLADAIVASSLASSTRPVSPVKRTDMGNRSLSLGVPRVRQLFGDAKSPTLAPQIPRTMKHTLRKERDVSEHEQEAQRRGRRHWVRKHPNVHHEGDRKRWRDTVTTRERKRYEGLWAANRGIHLEWLGPGADTSGTQEIEMVVNVVVRDIWERSHLAKDVLEEIWDLVTLDPNVKSLGREEFVLGLFLIDQRLKGKKLPTKLSESLLGSVRHIQGVKLSSKPMKR